MEEKLRISAQLRFSDGSTSHCQAFEELLNIDEIWGGDRQKIKYFSYLMAFDCPKIKKQTWALDVNHAA
jgi:hypothetical protein